MISKSNKFGFAILFYVSFACIANAREISTNTAQMQAMDKITGKVQIIEVPVNGEYRFGTFSIIARDCQTRPPEETPENFAFIDVVDINFDGSKENIFKGWMISSSPALNAIEHPVFDVWLLKCIDQTNIDKTKILSKEDLEERAKIEKRPREVSPLKISAPEELIIDDTVIIPENTPIVPAIEDNIDSNILDGIDEETLRRKLEDLGITEINSTEVIVSGFSDERKEILFENIDDKSNQDDEAINTDTESSEEIFDGSPKSLINFKKLQGE